MEGVSQGWRERYVGHDLTEKTSTLDGDHVNSYGRDENGRRITSLAAVAKPCHPELNWAAAGVIDLDGLRPLLYASGDVTLNRAWIPPLYLTWD